MSHNLVQMHNNGDEPDAQRGKSSQNEDEKPRGVDEASAIYGFNSETPIRRIN
ncbi:hypothetical protein TWF718_003497 [Orbilia javanica]|uniref:Uncharacterized protein n=1 Tax=Orbilia javanica TaxID=47235 RepID=A0AAN8NKT8_9PEZI